MLKHPYELNCSRELGHKTKTNLLSLVSYHSFLTQTPFFSVPFSFVSPQIPQKFKLPQTFISLPFELLGNRRFFTGRLVIMGGLGFSLAYFEDMALLGSNSGTKVYALAYE